MLHIVVGAAILVCAVWAIRAKRLLSSALWLAGTSALVALLMYLLGAPEVAVIELSVGAGLVTVLFVFAINIAGEEMLSFRSLMPKPLAWAAVLASVILLGWLSLPGAASTTVTPVKDQIAFGTLLWRDRAADVLLQIVLIFSGVLGVLGLLSQETLIKPIEEKKS